MIALVSTAAGNPAMHSAARVVRADPAASRRGHVFGTLTALALQSRVPNMDASPHPTLHETLIGFGLDERRIRQHLSPMTLAICDLVGLEMGLAVIEHLGGRQIALTKTPSEKAPLVRVVGEANARKIADFFGPDRHVTVPNPFSSRALLRLQGMKMLEDGGSYNDIAQKLRVSRNTVRAWSEKRPAPSHPEESSRDIAFRLFAAGSILAEVCEAVGVTSATARRWQAQWEDSL